MREPRCRASRVGVLLGAQWRGAHLLLMCGPGLWPVFGHIRPAPRAGDLLGDLQTDAQTESCGVVKGS